MSWLLLRAGTGLVGSICSLLRSIRIVIQLTVSTKLNSLIGCGDEGVAQRADAGDLDFDRIARLQIWRGAVGPHPDDVAGIEREIAGHRRNVGRHAEQHVVGRKARGYRSVDADD